MGAVLINERDNYKCFYTLLWNKEILNYLYQYRDVLTYVIVRLADKIYIYKLSNLPCFSKEISFGAGRNMTSTINMDITL